MKYQAIIVEDEQLNRDFLLNLLQEFCPHIEVAATAATVNEAVAAIRAHEPQIVFLDIELQTATGFDVLEMVRDHRFEIIFTTAYDHYAIKAIRFSAIDYLLKPINYEELTRAVSKAIEAMKIKQQDDRLELLMRNVRIPVGDDFSISLSTSEGIEYIPLTQISYLEAKGPYTTFFLKNGNNMIVCKHLKEYEMMLTEHGFFRLHNSYIVNMKEVKKMIRADGGYAVMNNDAMITISPRKKEEFLQLMNRRLV